MSTTLSPSASSSSLSSSVSRNSIVQAPPSPPSSSSASSSRLSLDQEDEDNATITVSGGKRKSHDDLRLLAISTHMTELSYTISDIQTRIFEIQELRHKSQSSGDAAGTTAIIDQSLMSLDERLDSVSKGMKLVNDALEPLLQSSSTPTLPTEGETNETTMLLRKHATLTSEWEAVQDESEVLREELKEDKWLTVFRTVTDQADGMMSSLEKGVNRCQEFIWQVHRKSVEDPTTQSQSSISSPRNDKTPPTFEVFTSLLESFEAKKKHYMPATSKVLSIIDKGVRDRVTKNGETLRRHAESAQRWRNLRERIARTDTEMENVRKILLRGDAGSEAGSSTSGTVSTRNGYLATPPSGSRQSGANKKSISRSMSPLKNFARKITGKSPASPVTPLAPNKGAARTPSSEPPPTIRRQKTSIFSLRSSQPSTPVSPGHKHTQSLTPDSSPQKQKPDATVKARTSLMKQPWNSSTKVSAEERALTMKGILPKRAPSVAGNYVDISPGPGGSATYRRSLSRTSMASSRPWSPLTSSVSTNNSTNPPMPTFRPPSRAQVPARPPSRTQTPSRATARPNTPGAGLPTPTPPRPRAKTPSHIPAPGKRLFSTPQSDAGYDDDPSLIIRGFSPAFSTSAISSASVNYGHPPRPPSRSMIPVPAVHLSSPSRPSTSMSAYDGRDSPSMTFRSYATRAQTPESALRAKVQQVPFWQGSVSRATGGGRPSLANKVPPSSFRDGSSTAGSRPPSRSAAGSRSEMYTPGLESMMPLHEYVPGNPKDPLDVEVGYVANSIAHGLLVERVDPPLKKIPKEGEEIKAQYAFSNALSRKVVTCRLTTLTRSGKAGDTTSKKVMCRVGGGWQDLSHYILNRQAGM